jgi:hypothetical protein
MTERYQYQPVCFGETKDRTIAAESGITYEQLLAEREERRLVIQDFLDTDWSSLLSLPFEAPQSP